MHDRYERALTWAMAVVLGMLVVAVVFLAANPTLTNPAHTELYVLDESGNASDYPSSLSPGETTEITVGISNHEHESVEYRLALLWNETTATERRIQLPDGATRELPITLTAPDQPGRYRLVIQLFHSGETTPDQTNRVWIRVQN